MYLSFVGVASTKQTDKLPVLKERSAYKVEFAAKIIYPICFIIFNIVYCQPTVTDGFIKYNIIYEL